MIVGTKALEMIAEHRSDEVVVTTMSSARVWPTMSSRPDLDIPLKGCMGKASSVGLGVALARPDKFHRFVSILVFVPRDKYDTQVRIRVGASTSTPSTNR